MNINITMSIAVRFNLFLKKTGWFKNRNINILQGILRNYKWSLHTSDDTYWSGIYDTKTIKELTENTKPGNVIFDIGANEGYLSLVCSVLTGKNGKVIAFEPLPENIEKLKKHISINNISNIIVVEKAVSDTSGQVNFSNTGDMADNTYIKNSPRFMSSGSSINVLSISIDDYCIENNESPDLIKIDVEGAELDVLTGAKKTIELYKPVIIISTHDCHMPGVKKKCLDILSAWGYSFYSLDNYSQEQEICDFVAKYN